MVNVTRELNFEHGLLLAVVFAPATHGGGAGARELQTGSHDLPIMHTLRELHARVEAGTVEILKKRSFVFFVFSSIAHLF